MPSETKALSITYCIDLYLEYCRTKEQSERTVQSKEECLSLFNDWCMAHSYFDIESVDIPMLERYQKMLTDYRKPHNGAPLCKGTKRNRLTSIKVMFATLFNKGILAENTLRKFELPKLGRRLPKPVLTEQEVRAVITKTEIFGDKGIRDRAIMETYYAAGLRRFELRNLTLNDLDLEQGFLREAQGKGLKDRYVPIAKLACASIYSYLVKVRPKLANKHSGLILFLANNGKPFRPCQLSELVSKYIRLADIRKEGACNQYRHAAATHMVDHGADIRHVQAFLGHADISTTQVYVHVSMAKLREVYNSTHPAANKW